MTHATSNIFAQYVSLTLHFPIAIGPRLFDVPLRARQPHLRFTNIKEINLGVALESKFMKIARNCAGFITGNPNFVYDSTADNSVCM